MGSIFRQNIPCWYNGHHRGWCCRGWKPELSLLTTKQIPNFQRFSSKLPYSTMKTTSEIIAAAWKWHWAPLNNNQISWYKTQLHFSSSQRSWSACYILLTAGYLWFMDGVINKPFLNPNLLIEEHSPLLKYVHCPLMLFLFPLENYQKSVFITYFSSNFQHWMRGDISPEVNSWNISFEVGSEVGVGDSVMRCWICIWLLTAGCICTNIKEFLGMRLQSYLIWISSQVPRAARLRCHVSQFLCS